MATLREEVQQRKKAISGVIKSTKAVVTSLNKITRLCKRLLARKSLVPDEKDLGDIITVVGEAINVAANLSRIPNDIAEVFRI